MKNRTGLVVSVLILFIIPIAGYFVLKQGAKDRMAISASLQPKDSLQLDFKVVQNLDDVIQASPLTDLDYSLKILVKDTATLNTDNFDEILYIINDRTDIGFIIYGTEAKVYQGDRIHRVKLSNYVAKVKGMGDILLIDEENRIIKAYQYGEDRLYGKLLEDISFLLPMLDYQKEQKLEEDGNK